MAFEAYCDICSPLPSKLLRIGKCIQGTPRGNLQTNGERVYTIAERERRTKLNEYTNVKYKRNSNSVFILPLQTLQPFKPFKPPVLSSPFDLSTSYPQPRFPLSFTFFPFPPFSPHM